MTRDKATRDAAAAVVADRWDLVIRPHRKWLDLKLGELWRYRDLVMLFVRRDFVSKYKQSILGPAWFIIQPLATTIVFTVIFGNVAKLPSDGMPSMLFYLCALVPWNYFAAPSTSSLNLLVRVHR